MVATTLISMLLAGWQSPVGARQLVFSQDFSAVQELASKDWIFNDGPVYNHEKETYTNRDGHNAWIESPNLVIESRNTDGKITSARLETVASWKHPYVEVVAKVPGGRGTWPAIWMLNDRLRHPVGEHVGWPKAGEIDIMENVGFDPPGFHFSLHSEEYNWMKPKQRTTTLNLPDPQNYHKFAVDVQPDVIVFYCDDKPAYTVPNKEKTYPAWPFDDSFYLILNLAIGGDWGGQKGIDDSIFPTRFLIKSVKVYE